MVLIATVYSLLEDQVQVSLYLYSGLPSKGDLESQVKTIAIYPEARHTASIHLWRQLVVPHVHHKLFVYIINTRTFFTPTRPKF